MNFYLLSTKKISFSKSVLKFRFSGVFEKSDGPIHIGDRVTMNVDAQRRTGNIRHHTATHLLNAAVRTVTKQPVCQKSSSVHYNKLKLELGILGRRVELDDLLQIEELVRQTIAAPTSVTCDVINANKLLELDSVTLVPGEIYPETNLRLIRIAGVVLKSTELCCGTHAHNTEELIDFTITSFRVTGRGSYLFSAVTGDEATQVRKMGETVLENVFTIQKDLSSGKQKLSDLETRIQRLRNILQNHTEDNLQIPHLVRLECMEILSEISREIKKSSRETLRDMVEIEMNTLLEQQEHSTHIVHFLETSPLMESVPLQKATKCCPNHPVLVLSLTDGVIKGRCCIPKQLITDSFTAEKWLRVMGNVFGAQIAPPKGQNAAEVCNMKAKKVNYSDFEEHLEIAINKANEFAELHLGPLKNRSDQSN
jgi:alanyl-tRNA synthetase